MSQQELRKGASVWYIQDNTNVIKGAIVEVSSAVVCVGNQNADSRSRPTYINLRVVPAGSVFVNKQDAINAAIKHCLERAAEWTAKASNIYVEEEQ